MSRSTTELELLAASFEAGIGQLPASYGPIVRAQLKLLRLLNSPELLSGVIDQVLHSVEESLRRAATDEERRVIQRHAASTIQATLFFTRATIICRIRENTEEARELVRQAGECIGESLAAFAAGDRASIMKSVNSAVRDMLSRNEDGRSFWRRLVDYFFTASDSRQETAAFFDTADSIFRKLGRHKRLIGQSMLISETIREYERHVSAHRGKQWRDSNPSPEGFCSLLGCPCWIVLWPSMAALICLLVTSVFCLAVSAVFETLVWPSRILEFVHPGTIYSLWGIGGGMVGLLVVACIEGVAMSRYESKAQVIEWECREELLRIAESIEAGSD